MLAQVSRTPCMIVSQNISEQLRNLFRCDALATIAKCRRPRCLPYLRLLRKLKRQDRWITVSSCICSCSARLIWSLNGIRVQCQSCRRISTSLNSVIAQRIERRAPIGRSTTVFALSLPEPDTWTICACLCLSTFRTS